MKKILIFLALLIGLMWSVTFILLPKIETQIDQMSDAHGSGSIDEKTPLDASSQQIGETHRDKEELDGQDVVRDRIESIRKRLALKGLIIEGDSYYRDGQLPLALKKYLEFYKKNPDDTIIIQKLADTYFEMHKYASAYNYYSKFTSGSQEIKEKTAQALVLMTKIDDPSSIADTRKKLKDLGLSEEVFFYYDTSLSCRDNFHNCKKDFGSYFWPEDQETTGSGTQVQEIQYPPLSRVKSAITNYQNFQVDEVYLKNAYIIGAWYSNGFYNLSASMGEQLLREKINYKPILKIVAQSYFELGKYKESREVLGTYYENDDEDVAVVYLLGIVNTKLREYILANIYFNKALELKYSDTASIYRELIHNYYALKNDDKMLANFVSLIESDDFNESDLSLGIYYHIIHEKYPQALTWAKKGQELYGQETGNFHTYEGWILTEKGQYNEAQLILQQGIEADGENPFVLINFGYNAIARGEVGEALIYFKKILSTSPNSEFATNAREEIKKLQNKE